MARKDLYKKDPAILFAHITSLCMGLGMLVWGVAPAFVSSQLTGAPIEMRMLLMNSLLFLLAMTFIGLALLIKQRVSWAAWASFTLSTTLVFVGVMAVIISKMHLSNASVIVFAVGNSTANWLAVGALARQRSPRRPATI
ncbi:MAG: hypothetical protein KDA32_12445 [Phycisphaerales bacterium]|nr:hypothetical protein [Phycisphaerales bacterium]